MMDKQLALPGTLGIVIQARMGSSRLPGKVLLPFYKDQTILSIIVEKFRDFGIPIVLATTTNKNDDVIVQFAKNAGIAFYRGDEENVINRFIGVAHAFDLDYLVRVCSDNPFLNTELFEELLRYAMELRGEFDYLSHRYQQKPGILTHFGVFVEFLRVSALKKVATFTNNAFYFEHVTNYLYTNPDKFKVQWLDLHDEYFCSDQLRLTIDTKEDFQMLASIYADLMKLYGNHQMENINTFVTNNKELLIRMAKQIKANTK